MEQYQTRPYQWFVDRIGKKIYRKGDSTPIKVKDAPHASFLCDSQIDFKYKYSDTK